MSLHGVGRIDSSPKFPKYHPFRHRWWRSYGGGVCMERQRDCSTSESLETQPDGIKIALSGRDMTRHTFVGEPVYHQLSLSYHSHTLSPTHHLPPWTRSLSHLPSQSRPPLKRPKASSLTASRGEMAIRLVPNVLSPGKPIWNDVHGGISPTVDRATMLSRDFSESLVFRRVSGVARSWRPLCECVDAFRRYLTCCIRCIFFVVI